MKKLKLNKSVSKAFICAFIFSTLLVTVSCKKTEQIYPEKPLNSFQLSNQEKALIGKWTLKKNETYEVDGIDSTGQFICSLISSTICNPSCKIEFINQFISSPQGPGLKGLGTLGGCDSNSVYLWRAKQQGVLEMYNDHFYNIDYLTKDSAVFSRVYEKDILHLKSVVYYNRH